MKSCCTASFHVIPQSSQTILIFVFRNLILIVNFGPFSRTPSAMYRNCARLTNLHTSVKPVVYLYWKNQSDRYHWKYNDCYCPAYTRTHTGLWWFRWIGIRILSASWTWNGRMGSQSPVKLGWQHAVTWEALQRFSIGSHVKFIIFWLKIFVNLSMFPKSLNTWGSPGITRVGIWRFITLKGRKRLGDGSGFPERPLGERLGIAWDFPGRDLALRNAEGA